MLEVSVNGHLALLPWACCAMGHRGRNRWPPHHGQEAEREDGSPGSQYPLKLSPPIAATKYCPCLKGSVTPNITSFQHMSPQGTSTSQAPTMTNKYLRISTVLIKKLCFAIWGKTTFENVYSPMSLTQNSAKWAADTSQSGKATAAKSDDTSLIPRTHKTEGKIWLLLGGICTLCEDGLLWWV